MKQEQNLNSNPQRRVSRLYVMVGAPGSGKSTFAKEHLSHIRYVSRDEVRFDLIRSHEDYFSKETLVFRTFATKIISALKHTDVVADATHLNVASRKKLIAAIQSSGVSFNIYFICMTTDDEECIRRNNLREGRAKVPEQAMREMLAKITYPTFDEFPNVKGVWAISDLGN